MTEEKVDAWMPLWIGAYLADTMALSRDSHGGYLLLLFAYWRNKGPLADDDEDLAAITKATAGEWKKLRPRLAKFFSIEDGLWRHKRADEELAKAGVHKAAATSRGKAGAAAKWEKERARREAEAAAKQAEADAASNAQALHKQCPTPTPPPVSVEPNGSTHTASGATHTEGGEYIGGAVDDQNHAAYGEIAGAIRRAGLAAVDPSYPKFRVLVGAGVPAEEFVRLVPNALASGGGSFAYLVGAVANERKRAAELAGQIHRGPMPTRTTAAEQRVLDAVPGVAAAHLRPAATRQTETFDVAARLVD